MDSELVAMEQRLNARFDGVDRRLDGVDRCLDKVDQRLDKVDQRFDKVDQRFDGVDGKLDQLDRTMHVLHEEAMSEFRFSLEAVEGTKEVLLRKFNEKSDSIEKTVELIARAVKANRAEQT